MYAGPARLGSPDDEYEAEVEIFLKWLPSPRVVWEPVGDLPFRFFAREVTLGEVTGAWPPAESRNDVTVQRRGTEATSVHVGDTSEVTCVRAYLINFYVPVSAHRAFRRPIKWSFGPWQISIEEASASDDTSDYLKATRLYAPTHLVEITRFDGDRFTREAVDRLLDRLFVLLAFMNGALVGFALPAGYDGEELVWCDLEVTRCGRGGFAFSWTDPHHFHVQAAEFVEKSWEPLEDEYLNVVLGRVIRMAVEANHLSPVDVTIPLAQSALELLSWAVLVEREHWLAPSVKLDAAHRVRLLLRWAGIPTGVPPQLADAVAHAAIGGTDDFDGPRVVTSVRNNIVHPPRRGPEWPSRSLETDAWRLALGYIDLVVLRLCGYVGMYASRHHVDGRWVGTVDPVPWAGDENPQRAGR